MAVSQNAEDLMCSICLEFFETPKVLSCTHTFCENCLQASFLESSVSGFIACPQCHTNVPLPEGGIASLTTDEPISRAVKNMKESRGTSPELPTTTTHSLCKDCNALVCENCKHNVKANSEPALWSRTERGDMLSRVSLCEQRIRYAMENIKMAEQTIRKNQDAKESLIRARKDILLQLVHDAFIKSLTTLESTSKQLIAKLHVDEMVLAERQQNLKDVRKSITNTMDRETSKHDTTADKISKERLQSLVSSLPFHTDIPVMHFNDHSASPSSLQDFLGLAVPFQPIPVLPEVTLTLMFRCCEDSQTDVHAVCPVQGGRVWVSHGHSVSNTRGELSLFSEQGVPEKTQFTGSGVCIARARGEWIVAENRSSKVWLLTPNQSSEKDYTDPEQEFRMYCKLDARFYLCSQKNGKNELKSVSTKDGHDGIPAITGTNVCDFTLSSRPLAMDVSSNGKIIAVLEEGNNNVLIFNDSEDPAPYLTYSPPLEDVNATFKPRDLCFFSFGSQERLVVADWSNDVLLVLQVTEESCVLIGHLEDRSHVLVKPTAVTADEGGRLWVGCRGGDVLTIKQRHL